VSTSPSKGTTPPSGFSMAALDTPSGHRCVLVASTEEAREKGLMGFQTVAPWDGMLFTFDGRPVRSAFYMNDTLIPLDIAFVDGDGMVQEVLTMEPCPPEARSCPLYQPQRSYVSALEVEKGKASAFGIAAGAKVTAGGTC